MSQSLYNQGSPCPVAIEERLLDWLRVQLGSGPEPRPGVDRDEVIFYGGKLETLKVLENSYKKQLRDAKIKIGAHP